MGNAIDSQPSSYNTSGGTHELDYMQTYYHRDIPGDDKIGDVHIGAKIIQAIEPPDKIGEYYVMSLGWAHEHGHEKEERVYLSENGDWKASAQSLLRYANGYQNGPTIMLSGSPGHPVYEAWASTDTVPGEEWEPLRINSLDDFENAIRLGHGGTAKHGKKEGFYGDMAVNPFEKKPRDIWSDTSDFNRTVNKIGKAFIVPMITYGLDEFTGGIGGTVFQLTGLDSLLQESLDKLDDVAPSGYKSNLPFTDPRLSDAIHDPRLESYFKQVYNASFSNADQNQSNSHSKELQRVLSGRKETRGQKVVMLKKMQTTNLAFSGEKQVKTLQNTVNILKKVAPNIPGWDWNIIDAGINAAQTPEQQINAVKAMTLMLSKKVFPFLPPPKVMTPQGPQGPPPKLQTPANQHETHISMADKPGSPHVAQKTTGVSASDPGNEPSSATINGTPSYQAEIHGIAFIPGF